MVLLTADTRPKGGAAASQTPALNCAVTSQTSVFRLAQVVMS